MSSPSLSIIIPAYNEEKRISPLLDELSSPDIEYIFVCDGTDSTVEVIRKFSDKHPDLTIRCLTYSCRLGKGGGVYAGFKEASSDIVGFMDADNSTPVSELIRLYTLMGSHDGVIGSRHIPGQVLQRKQSISRRFQSRIFNGLIRMLFGLDFHDTQCGAKVFRRSAVSAVLPYLHAHGFEFDVELLWHLHKRDFSVIEIPVIWNDTHDSRLRLTDTFSMFHTLLRIRTGTLPHEP
ncbi:MAG: glycosyltransferase family 2 protein [Methanospirillum sp.]|nr:glycosyltransferase family 2 protein [Methanospirillum sp.]